MFISSYRRRHPWCNLSDPRVEQRLPFLDPSWSSIVAMSESNIKEISPSFFRLSLALALSPALADIKIKLIAHLSLVASGLQHLLREASIKLRNAHATIKLISQPHEALALGK
jgi:hypothetical protein